MIGPFVALLAAAGPPPQQPRPPTAREDVVVTAERVTEPRVTDRRWEEVGLALPDFRGELVPYYFPGAGFTARVGMEWSFQ